MLVASNELEEGIAYGLEEAVLVDSSELDEGIAYGFKELVLVANNTLEVHGVEEAVAKIETTGEEVGHGVEDAVLDANGAAALAYSFAFKSPTDAFFTEALSDWATELDLAFSFIFVSAY